MELRKIPLCLYSCTFWNVSYISMNNKGFSSLKPKLRPSICAYSTVSPKCERSLNTYHPWPSTADLTPYTILGFQPGERYSKQRYYELVKIYHPDRFQIVSSSLSYESRTQRYRLVVAAHEILCDPEKRSEYDRYGLGWTHSSRVIISRRPEAHGNDCNPKQAAMGFNFSEDLQHQRLAVLVLAVAFFFQFCYCVGDSYKAEIQAKKAHDQCWKLIQTRRQRASSLSVPDAQMETFLLRRDPTGTGVTKLEEPVYREVLPYCSYESG